MREASAAQQAALPEVGPHQPACCASHTDTVASSSTNVTCLLQASAVGELAGGDAPAEVSAVAAEPAAGQQQLQAGGAGEQARAEAAAAHSAVHAAPAAGQRQARPSSWPAPLLSNMNKMRALPTLTGNYRLMRSADFQLADLLAQPQPLRAWYSAAKVLSALVDAGMQPSLKCQQRVAAWIAAGGPESAGDEPHENLPWCQRTVLVAWARIAMRSGGGEASRSLPDLVRVLREPLRVPPQGRELAAEKLVRMTFARVVEHAGSPEAVEDAVHGARAFLDIRAVMQGTHALARVTQPAASAAPAPAPPHSSEQPAAGGDCAPPAPEGGAAAPAGQKPRESGLQLLIETATAWLDAQPASQAPATFDSLASVMNELHRLRVRGALLADFLQRSCAWLAAADWGALAAAAGANGPVRAAWILRAWAAREAGWVPEALPPPPPQTLVELARLAASAVPGRALHAADGPGMLLYRIRYLVRAHMGLVNKPPGKLDAAAWEAGLAAQRTISRGLAGRLDAVALAALRQQKARTAERVVGVAGALLAVEYRPTLEVTREFLAAAAPLVARMDDEQVRVACRALWKWHMWYGLAFERPQLEAFAAAVRAPAAPAGGGSGAGRGGRMAQKWLSALLASHASAGSAGAPGEAQGPAGSPGAPGELQEPGDLPGASGKGGEPADLPEVTGEVQGRAGSPSASGELQEPGGLPGASGKVVEPAGLPEAAGEVQATESLPDLPGEVQEHAGLRGGSEMGHETSDLPDELEEVRGAA